MNVETQQLLRELSPRVLSSLVRRYRDLGACEDALQEAMIAAARQWPERGVPDDPRAWLTSVAIRRMVDHVRAETARRLRESIVVSLVPPEEQLAMAADDALAASRDDTLELFFMS
jgi:predicted RNA polymerase sigma factor